MSALSIFFAALYYLAAAILVVGLAFKIRQYALTPAPLKIPLTPAPLTRAGVGWRLTRELLFFQSLFRASKWTWVFSWVFHVALLLVLFHHVRFTLEEFWSPIGMIPLYNNYASVAMLLGLAGLWARRFLVDRVRYISTPSDHLMLALLVAIGLTGLGMNLYTDVDILAVKAFVFGLMQFSILPLPAEPLLLLHMFLVAVLMIIFPISKLLHAPGLFFSPTRNMSDNPREARHLASWAAKLDK